MPSSNCLLISLSVIHWPSRSSGSPSNLSMLTWNPSELSKSCAFQPGKAPLDTKDAIQCPLILYLLAGKLLPMSCLRNAIMPSPLAIARLEKSSSDDIASATPPSVSAHFLRAVRSRIRLNKDWYFALHLSVSLMKDTWRLVLSCMIRLASSASLLLFSRLIIWPLDSRARRSSKASRQLWVGISFSSQRGEYGLWSI